MLNCRFSVALVLFLALCGCVTVAGCETNSAEVDEPSQVIPPDHQYDGQVDVE